VPELTLAESIGQRPLLLVAWLRPCLFDQHFFESRNERGPSFCGGSLLRFSCRHFTVGNAAAAGRPSRRVRYSCREDLADPLADDVGMPAKPWSEWQDLNLRPPRPERGALPDLS
jgi:hypothetical protein